MALIHQLNDLYRTAIEHFAHDDPRKVMHFQKKLNKLLTHPQTLQAIDNFHPINDSPTRKTSQSGTYNRNLRTELSKFDCESGALVKGMMEGAQQRGRRRSALINAQIDNQEQLLRNRL